MLKRRTISFLAGIIIVCSSGFAADDAGKGNIHPNIKVSFTERFRFVSWDNTTTLSEDFDGARAFTRHRTSVMGQWLPTESFELGLKLTNEFRHYFVPQYLDFTIDEVFVDQLYARGSYDRFTLTLGRQNIMLGEGFVMMDGGPLDGSRSAYFNAARLDVKPCPEGTLSLLYFYQPVHDDYLPLVNDQDKILTENDEQGFGAYVSRDFGKSNVQAYYIRKNIIDTSSSEVVSGINTVGARLNLPFDEQWSLTVEFAYQFGTFGEVNRKAYGGHFHLDYKTDWPAYLPSKLTVGGGRMSGDDISTVDWEGWEPVFGRWPKWSESYIYTLPMEQGVAYWSNYASIYGRVQYDITPDLGIRFEYQRLSAPYAYSGSPTSSTGNRRGDMAIGKVTYRVSEYLCGHILWEHFNPGNFYWASADEADWLRFELMLSIQ